MKTVYILEHIYEFEEKDEIKFIGVFSSKENATKAINKLIKINGFKDYPIDCFQISENLVDKINWEEGFIKWEDAI